MARRLTVEGYDGGRPVAIPDVPAPLRGGGRAHSVARVLEIALEHAGLPLGYDAIMGLCGLAFRTPAWPHNPEPSLDDATDAISALSEALSGCMTMLTDTDAPSEDDLLDAVAGSVEAGRPCAAFGWGSEKERWSVITGYDGGKGRLLGHCTLDAPREQYESWPPDLRVMVVITDEPRPRGPEAVGEALNRGAERWEREGAGRYRAWMEEMNLLEDAPGAGHEQSVELLADARAAAAGFAQRVAERERELPAAWLARAAEHWREVVRLLEARGVPHSREALEALRTAENRRDWAELLQVAAGIEEEAAACVRLSRSADYPPEEASPW